jgi:hypothetical protein
MLLAGWPPTKIRIARDKQGEGGTTMNRKSDNSASRTNRAWVQPLLIAIGIASLSLVSGSIALAGPKSKPFVPAQGSTSPENGDLNPYGLAVVPNGFPKGTLQPGQLLVSNFNDSANIQGNGSTIVIMDPATGQQTGVFFQGTLPPPGPLAGNPPGFTNALGIVEAGFVFAGSVTSTAESGGLLVIDSSGNLVTTIESGTDGPWGLAINDRGKNAAQLFISNVLDGTVTRISVSFDRGSITIGSATTIASGYAFGPDAAGLVVGPAGLAYDSSKDILYLAAEDDNQIFAIAKARDLNSASGKGTLIFSDQNHLHGPLGLMIAPNGDLITANADPAAHVDPSQPSELVEFTTSGKFVRQFSIDPNTGSAFAILNVASGGANQFAYVDDFLSILNIMRFAK